MKDEKTIELKRHEIAVLEYKLKDIITLLDNEYQKNVLKTVLKKLQLTK